MSDFIKINYKSGLTISFYKRDLVLAKDGDLMLAHNKHEQAATCFEIEQKEYDRICTEIGLNTIEEEEEIKTRKVLGYWKRHGFGSEPKEGWD